MTALEAETNMKPKIQSSSGSVISRLMERGITWLTSGPHAQYGAAALRIVLSLTLIVQLIVNFPFKSYLWGPASAWSQEIAAGSEFPFQRALFGPIADSTTVTVAYFVLLAASGALLLGWHTRMATLIVLVLHTSMTFSDGIYMDQSDNLVRMILIYGLFMHLGARWSLDARYDRLLSERRQELGRVPSNRDASWKVFTRTIHNLALCALAVHLCLIYVSSAMFKIQGSAWQDGTAVYFPLQVPHFRPFPALSDMAVSSDIAVNIATYAAVYLQLFFPFMLFNKWTRRVALVGISGMHLSIAVLMGLPFFSAFMLAGDAIFVSSATYVAASAWVASKLRRSSKESKEPQGLVGQDSDLIFDESSSVLVASPLAAVRLVPEPVEVDDSDQQLWEPDITELVAGTDLIADELPVADIELVADTELLLAKAPVVEESPALEAALYASTEFATETEPALEQEPTTMQVNEDTIYDPHYVFDTEPDSADVASASEDALEESAQWSFDSRRVDVNSQVNEETIRRIIKSTEIDEGTISSFRDAISSTAGPQLTGTSRHGQETGVEESANSSSNVTTGAVSPAVWAEGAYARFKRSQRSALSSLSSGAPASSLSSGTAENRITTEELRALLGTDLQSVSSFLNALPPHTEPSEQQVSEADQADEFSSESLELSTTVPSTESGLVMSAAPATLQPKVEVEKLFSVSPRDNADTRAVSRKLAYYGNVLDTLPPHTSELQQLSFDETTKNFSDPDDLAQPLTGATSVVPGPTSEGFQGNGTTSPASFHDVGRDRVASLPVGASLLRSNTSARTANGARISHALPSREDVITHVQVPPPIGASEAIAQMNKRPRNSQSQVTAPAPIPVFREVPQTRAARRSAQTPSSATPPVE